MFKAISSKLNGGVAAVGRTLITHWGRQWADGKMGPGASKVYFFLSAHAAQITLALSVIAGSLVAAAQMPGLLALVGLDAPTVAQWGAWLAYAAPILVSLKLATDQWHSVEKPAWMAKPWALWLKDHASTVSVVFGGAFWYAEQCQGGGWCDVERWAIFAAGVVGANFGILPSAAKAIPPAEVLKALAGLVDAPTPAVAKQAATIDAMPTVKSDAVKDVLAAVANVDPQDKTLKPDVKTALSEVSHEIAAAKEEARG